MTWFFDSCRWSFLLGVRSLAGLSVTGTLVSVRLLRNPVLESLSTTLSVGDLVPGDLHIVDNAALRSLKGMQDCLRACNAPRHFACCSTSSLRGSNS